MLKMWFVTDFAIYQWIQSYCTYFIIGRCCTRFGIAMYSSFDIVWRCHDYTRVPILQHLPPHCKTSTACHMQTVATALHWAMHQNQYTKEYAWAEGKSAWCISDVCIDGSWCYFWWALRALQSISVEHQRTENGIIWSTRRPYPTCR